MRRKISFFFLTHLCSIYYWTCPVLNQTVNINVYFQALAASPCGRFVVIGIAEKIYVYQTCTGKLLNVIARHYQVIFYLGQLSLYMYIVTVTDG
jgi:hypothetical protein